MDLVGRFHRIKVDFELNAKREDFIKAYQVNGEGREKPRSMLTKEMRHCLVTLSVLMLH